MVSCSPPSEERDEPVGQSRRDVEVVATMNGVHAPRLILDGEGLIVSDTPGGGRTIAFGSPAAGAIATARQIYGEPENVAKLEECGAGPLEASRFGGMTLASQDAKFVGWWLDGRHEGPLPTTERGIGIGSTRAQLEGAHSVDEFESSLGAEFTADGLAGLIEGDGKSGKITNLWAGATCIMR